MTLEQFASLAEIIAGIGVIISLIFLATQVRQYTEETSNSNWALCLDRYITMASRGLTEELASVVTRGRKDYKGLSETEQFMFGSYMIEVALAHEALVFLGNQVLRPDIREVPDKTLKYWFSQPGVSDWYEEFKAEKGGFSPKMNEYIDQLVATGPQRQRI